MNKQLVKNYLKKKKLMKKLISKEAEKAVENG